MNRSKFLFTLFALCGISLSAKAVEQLTPGQLFPHPRAMALGGAYLAMPQEGHSVFYNPAGLTTTRGVQLEGANLQFHGSGPIYTELNPGDLNSDVFNLSEQAKVLRDRNGGSMYRSYGVFPHFAAENFILGILYRNQTDAYAPDGSGENLTYSAQEDLGGFLGTGFRVFNGLIRFGVVGKFLYRLETPETSVSDSAAVTDLRFSSNNRSGSIFNADAGFQLVLPFAMLPTLSASWKNLGETEFTGSDTPLGQGETTLAPSDVQERIDAGFSLSPWLARGLRLRVAADYLDVEDQTNIRDDRRIRGGMELDFKGAVFLRGGYVDKNASYGVGFHSGKTSIDFASYILRRSESEDVDLDQRYLFRITVKAF
jgi:hypothetical protein